MTNGGIDMSNQSLLSDLFDGFIFIVAVLVFIIAIGIVTVRYRKKPSLRGRRALTTLSVLLTVVDSLLLVFKIDFLSFLFNPYDYFTSRDLASIADSSVFGIYLSYYIAVIITILVGVVFCIIGYCTVANKELTQKAFNKANILPQFKNTPKYCAVCGCAVGVNESACSRCGSTVFAVNQQAFNAGPQFPPPPPPQFNNNCPTWQCNICGTVNNDVAGGEFCSQCGAPKNIVRH